MSEGIDMICAQMKPLVFWNILSFVELFVIWQWSISSYSSGLLQWQWDNHAIAQKLMKQLQKYG